MGTVEQLESRLIGAVGERRTGLLAMVAAMLLWPIIEAIGGTLLVAMPPLELVWLRYFFHLSFMLLVVSPRRPVALFRTRYPARQVGRSLLMLTMPWCWILAAGRVPISVVMAIFWTTPVFAVAAAAILLRERVRPSTIVLLGMGYCAAIFVLHPVLPHSRGGVLLALGMSLSFAVYLVGTRWLRREPMQVNLFHSALSVFVVLTFAMPFIWRRPDPAALGTALVIGLLGYALLWCLDRAVHHAAVAVVAPLAFIQPVIETIWFNIAAGGTVSRRALLGLVLMLAVVIASFAMSRNERVDPIA
jgi:drug/metabolite transporter (DMT)-like permease